MKKALRTGSIEKAKALMIVLVGVRQAQSGQFDSTTRKNLAILMYHHHARAIFPPLQLWSLRRGASGVRLREP
jgi:hypothetical protein